MGLCFLLVLSLCIPFNKVDAKSSGGHERHHRLHGSREVKSTLQITRDNEFECVDIYKQPSFDHPLLKNHKIQLYPTLTRDRMKRKSLNVKKGYTLSPLNKGCPPGKVPIHHGRQMRHQMGSKTSSIPSLQNFSQFSKVYPNHHFTTLDTTRDTIYRGAAAGLNPFNLSLQGDQYSLAQIWLQSGPPNPNLNSVQAGWGVHPGIYGNSLARLTGYWTSDNFQNSGCYNILCPGFMQINQKYAFGSLLTPVDDGSHLPPYADVEIFQDQTYGNWWLTLDDIEIGYWPRELLTNLYEGARVIRYGGETFSPPNKNSPPMGSGKLAESKFGNSGFFVRVSLVDSEFKLKDVIPEDMKINSDTSPNCYDLLYHGFQDQDYLQAFLYGGPGGQCGT